MTVSIELTGIRGRHSVRLKCGIARCTVSPLLQSRQCGHENVEYRRRAVDRHRDSGSAGVEVRE